MTKKNEDDGMDVAFASTFAIVAVLWVCMTALSLLLGISNVAIPVLFTGAVLIVLYLTAKK